MADSRNGIALPVANAPVPTSWQYGPPNSEKPGMPKPQSPTYGVDNPCLELQGKTDKPYPVSTTTLAQPPSILTEQSLGPGMTTVTQGTTPQTTVVIQTSGFSSVPVNGICENCGANVTTRISYVAGNGTWSTCCLLCLICPLLCWIPFCMDSQKDVQHHCPECNHLMGVRRRE